MARKRGVRTRNIVDASRNEGTIAGRGLGVPSGVRNLRPTTRIFGEGYFYSRSLRATIRRIKNCTVFTETGKERALEKPVSA